MLAELIGAFLAGDDLWYKSRDGSHFLYRPLSAAYAALELDFFAGFTAFGFFLSFRGHRSSLDLILSRQGGRFLARYKDLA
jgi:hypothetical protein